jgi:hypothetical protein
MRKWGAEEVVEGGTRHELRFQVPSTCSIAPSDFTDKYKF